MSKNYTQINATADTFQTLVDRVNDLVRTLGNETITANTSTDGALTTGNSYVAGIFGSLILTANNIRGGYPNISAPLTVTSNLIINTNFSIVSGNSKINATMLSVGTDVLLNTSVCFVGNSSGNSTQTRTGFVVGNAVHNATSVMVGNSTVFSMINSTSVYVQNTMSSALLSPSSISIGNSVVNTTITSQGVPPGGIQSIAFGDATANLIANVTGLYVANTMGVANLTPIGLRVGASYINTAMMGIGANITINTSLIIVSNTTNFAHLSNAGIYCANNHASAPVSVVNCQNFYVTSNAGACVIRPDFIQIANPGSTQTFTIAPTNFSVGNGTVYTSVNSTMIYVNKIFWKDGSSQQGGGFVAGTRMFFTQAAVPVGWALDAGIYDCAVRAHNSYNGVWGGADGGYSTCFNYRAFYTTNTTLTEGHLVPHTHIFQGYYGKISGGDVGQVDPGSGYTFWTEAGILSQVSQTGGGTAHNHYFELGLRPLTLDTLVGIKQ